MKRLSSSDSQGGLVSICPNSTVDVDDHSHGNNPMYTADFQTMLDEEGSGEEPFQTWEKKRRLSLGQVKALEKNFEVENKLEPERKIRLAQELGLQPRQVAVWFQNRRARWKTKQLERDYGVLKANYDALKHKYESLQLENESLHIEIRELKTKLNGSDGKISVKEEKCDLETRDDGAAVELNLENCDIKEYETIFKDGSSDSDSSAIMNEDNSPIAAAISSSNGILHHIPNPFLNIQGGGLSGSAGDANQNHENETQLVKIEEHNFFGEESCSSLFREDQAPSLHWYCNDEWN